MCAEYAGFFPERFEEACLIEVQELVDCVLQNKAPGVSVYDRTKSTAIGCALQVDAGGLHQSGRADGPLLNLLFANVYKAFKNIYLVANIFPRNKNYQQKVSLWKLNPQFSIL